jgi:hypothetical protein
VSHSGHDAAAAIEGLCNTPHSKGQTKICLLAGIYPLANVSNRLKTQRSKHFSVAFKHLIQTAIMHDNKTCAYNSCQICVS